MAANTLKISTKAKSDAVVLAQARENSHVEKVSSKKGEVLKKGIPADHERKHEKCVIGMNVGMTLNMGSYESLRLDVWATVPQTDEPMQKQYSRLRESLNSVIEESMNEYKGS